jgi:tetratricopeptide (TPR) repeat protein
LQSYRASLAIAEGLAGAQPGNTEWQRDRSVALKRIGEVLVEQGNPAAALESYQASRIIADSLVKDDPGNPNWERDLAISHGLMGDLLRAQGNLSAALDSYRAAHAIFDRLAKSKPISAEWQRDLATSHWKLAAAGDSPRERFGEVVRILRDMKARGILAPRDEQQYLPAAEAQLAKLAGK